MARNRPRREWPEVLTKAEAAEYLRCSLSKIQQLTRDGLLKPYRIGDRPRFPLPMLERFVAEATGDDHAAAS